MLQSGILETSVATCSGKALAATFPSRISEQRPHSTRDETWKYPEMSGRAVQLISSAFGVALASGLRV